MFIAFLLTVSIAEAKRLPFETLTATTEVPEKGVIEVRRSIEIAAAPELVVPYLTHLDTWKSWTAWNETNCAGTVWTYTGTQGEAGASMAWTGKECGKGSMTVTTLMPGNSGATYDTFFGKNTKDPMKGLISVTPTATGSTVEWRDVMSYGFPMSLFLSRSKMDTMLGDDFALGLAGLKVRAEADAAKAAEAARIVAEEAAKKAAEEAAAKAAEEAAKKAAEEAAAAKKAADEAAAKPKKKGGK